MLAARRHQLMDAEEWPRINRLLKKIPLDVESDKIPFLLLLGWQREKR
jgi:hypothetical protein